MKIATLLFLGLLLVPVPSLSTIVYPFPSWTPELQKMAEAGDPESQKVLGLDYYVGWGIQRDEIQALKWLHRAADRGHLPAKFQIGVFYQWNKDYKTAMKWFREAADKGSTEARLAIGYAYFRGEGVKKDSAEAEKWYRKAATQGDAQTKYNLANMYYTGGILKKNNTEEMRWLKKAASQGSAWSLKTIGESYQNGWGVKRDYAEAYYWLSLWNWTAHKTDTPEIKKKLTQSQLAVINKRISEWWPSDTAVCAYGKENFTAMHYKEALAILQPLADRGVACAQNTIGAIYEEGEETQGIRQDSAEAVKWFRKSAMQGYRNAQLNLFMAYLLGRGVGKSDAEAYYWLSLSARADSLVVDDEYYKSHLTPEQKAAVEKRVSKWKSSKE